MAPRSPDSSTYPWPPWEEMLAFIGPIGLLFTLFLIYVGTVPLCWSKLPLLPTKNLQDHALSRYWTFSPTTYHLRTESDTLSSCNLNIHAVLSTWWRIVPALAAHRVNEWASSVEFSSFESDPLATHLEMRELHELSNDDKWEESFLILKRAQFLRASMYSSTATSCLAQGACSQSLSDHHDPASAWTWSAIIEISWSSDVGLNKKWQATEHYLKV